MIVHVIEHETDGVLGVYSTAETAMAAIYTVSEWKHYPSMGCWKGGPYRILEETVKP